MPAAVRPSLVTAALLGLALLPGAPSVLSAQTEGTAPCGGLGDADPEPPAAPRVFYRLPITPQAAKTWAKLDKAVAMPFENETTLEDVIAHIKRETASPGEAPLPVYVDPIGLQEAEKTMQSPITMSLEGVPLRTTLRLMLKQLGLAYGVQEDGLLIITAEGGEEGVIEPMSLILDEIRALRKEIAELRKELDALRGAGAPRQ
jgi:hypothetical protein